VVRCPGQDTRQWKPKDIFEAPCPACGRRVEFFKDDTSRKCPRCGYTFRNPKLDLGCAEWCPYADKCLAEGRMLEKQKGGARAVDESSK